VRHRKASTQRNALRGRNKTPLVNQPERPIFSEYRGADNREPRGTGIYCRSRVVSKTKTRKNTTEEGKTKIEVMIERTEKKRGSTGKSVPGGGRD